MQHFTVDQIAILSRLEPLDFNNNNALQTEFYEYLTNKQPCIHSIPYTFSEIIDRFYHLDDHQPIQNAPKTLGELIKQAGELLRSLTYCLHTPDGYYNNTDYKKIKNLPNFLREIFDPTKDYYLEIDEHIRENATKSDEAEQQLHEHMKRMGEAYIKLLTELGIEIL